MYNQKLPALMPVTKAAAVQVLTAAANIAAFIAMAKLMVRRVSFVVTVATVSTGGIVLTFYKRPVSGGGVATNQVVLGTITIPTAVAAGVVYYLELGETCVLQPGESIECDVTTAAAGGGAAGSGYFLPQEAEESPEIGVNYTNAVKVLV